MAKLKSSIRDFGELSGKIKEYGIAEAELRKLQAEYDKEELALVNSYNGKFSKVNEKLVALRADMELFCQENKKEFPEGKRVKKLLFGSVGFQASKKGGVQLLKKVKDGFRKAADDVRNIFGDKYIRLVPELNKELLGAACRAGEISDTMLAACNLRFDRDEQFVVKVNYKKLEQEGVILPVQSKKKGAA